MLVWISRTHFNWGIILTVTALWCVNNGCVDVLIIIMA